MLNTLILKKKNVQHRSDQPAPRGFLRTARPDCYRNLSGVNLFVFIISFFLVGCGNSKKDGDMNLNATEGMREVELTSYGFPIFINIPQATTSSLEITENPQGGVDVKVNENIQMAISEGTGDMVLKKNDITHDDVRRFVKYVIDEPDAIVWEWQIEGMETEFHFYTIIKAGEKSFEVSNVEGKMFSEKSALQMLDIAKSIRLNETVKTGS